jgi:hypothetical protein
MNETGLNVDKNIEDSFMNTKYNSKLTLQSETEYMLIFDIKSYAESDNETASIIIVSDNYKSLNIIRNIKRFTKKINIIIPISKIQRDINIRILSGEINTKSIFTSCKILNISDNIIEKIPFTQKHRFSDILNRFKYIFNDRSSLVRYNFFKDSIKTIKNESIFGNGAGAFNAFAPKYQDFYYWSQESHSYLLDIIIETGIFGLLTILFFIFILIANFIKKFKDKSKSNYSVIIHFIIIVTFISHSVMDFNMSIPIVFIYFLILLAIYINYNNINFTGMSDIKIKPYYLVIMIIFINMIITIPVLRSTYTYIKARTYADNGDYKETVEHIKAAKEFVPLNEDYKIEYANLILGNPSKQKEFDKTIGWLEENKVDNYSIIYELVKIYYRLNDVDNVLLNLELLYSQRPRNPGNWDNIIKVYKELLLKKYNKENNDIIYKHFKAVYQKIQNSNLKNISPQYLYKETEINIALIENIKSKNYVISPDEVLNTNYILFPDLDFDFNGIPDQIKEVDYIGLKQKYKNEYANLIRAEKKYFNKTFSFEYNFTDNGIKTEDTDNNIHIKSDRDSFIVLKLDIKIEENKEYQMIIESVDKKLTEVSVYIPGYTNKIEKTIIDGNNRIFSFISNRSDTSFMFLYINDNIKFRALRILEKQ